MMFEEKSLSSFGILPFKIRARNSVINNAIYAYGHIVYMYAIIILLLFFYLK